EEKESLRKSYSSETALSSATTPPSPSPSSSCSETGSLASAIMTEIKRRSTLSKDPESRMTASAERRDVSNAKDIAGPRILTPAMDKTSKIQHHQFPGVPSLFGKYISSSKANFYCRHYLVATGCFHIPFKFASSMSVFLQLHPQLMAEFRQKHKKMFKDGKNMTTMEDSQKIVVVQNEVRVESPVYDLPPPPSNCGSPDCAQETEGRFLTSSQRHFDASTSFVSDDPFPPPPPPIMCGSPDCAQETEERFLTSSQRHFDASTSFVSDDPFPPPPPPIMFHGPTVQRNVSVVMLTSASPDCVPPPPPLPPAFTFFARATNHCTPQARTARGIAQRCSQVSDQCSNRTKAPPPPVPIRKDHKGAASNATRNARQQFCPPPPPPPKHAPGALSGSTNSSAATASHNGDDDRVVVVRDAVEVESLDSLTLAEPTPVKPKPPETYFDDRTSLASSGGGSERRREQDQRGLVVPVRMYGAPIKPPHTPVVASKQYDASSEDYRFKLNKADAATATLRARASSVDDLLASSTGPGQTASTVTILAGNEAKQVKGQRDSCVARQRARFEEGTSIGKRNSGMTKGPSTVSMFDLASQVAAKANGTTRTFNSSVCEATVIEEPITEL
ncbi:unnamed protein product, partial [Notodromas monacha]